MSSGTLWRLVSDFAVCGLVVREGVVVEAAPILRWARGSRWSAVRSSLIARGWHGESVGAVGVKP